MLPRPIYIQRYLRDEKVCAVVSWGEAIVFFTCHYQLSF
jgi:hypothetical protein